MSRISFFTAAVILCISLTLQFLFASAGIFINLVLAVLITFAFALDFWELCVLVLCAVFVLNWQPMPSIAIIVFALIPLAAYGFKTFARLELWIGNAAALVFGFLLFYVIAAPGEFLGNLPGFFVNLLAALLVGELVLFLLA
jgi:hypothetical protein